MAEGAWRFTKADKGPSEHLSRKEISNAGENLLSSERAQDLH